MCFFSVHVTKRRSDWPELFGMVRTKEMAQRYQMSLSVAILLVKMVGCGQDYGPCVTTHVVMHIEGVQFADRG